MLPRHFLPLLLLFCLLPTLAAAAKKQPPLRVGIAGTAPFINGDTTGIAIDIWREIAAEMAQPYLITRFASEHEALAALEAGEVDAVVGPVTISSDRAERFGLTQPYCRASLSILSRSDEFDLWGRIQPFFSKRLLYATGVFVFILACVGTLLWLAERKDNEQFPTSPARGIGNGMWCAISTMTTTGYGDIAPVTLAGRIIAGAWMVISFLFATSMVAGIASTLTLTGMNRNVIDNADQFGGKKIAVLQDS
ncbi:MAG: transporter substrate-binding domain-containing protein, partial [Bacteroidetes bacterium]|nr:transporter substrate-binding domain-containing protein [Bacteroidota bacterium]